MSTICKITFTDNVSLRTEIDNLYENATHLQVSNWSIKIAKKILKQHDWTTEELAIFKDWFRVHTLYRKGKAKVYDLRNRWFAIHKLARKKSNEVDKIAIRVIGQAVASAHMKEHAIIASDYAIKLIWIKTHNDLNEITKERQHQLKELIKISNNVA